MINRTQALVLGFFLLAWVSLVVILTAAPEVYDQALRLPPGGRRPGEVVFLTVLSAVIAWGRSGLCGGGAGPSG